MEELGVKPNVSIVSMLGNVFQQLGMMDKYEKLTKKYPPPKWEYRYIKGKRVRISAKRLNEFNEVNKSSSVNGDEMIEDTKQLNESDSVSERNTSDADEMIPDIDGVYDSD